jgi:hypothetical protein
MVQDLSCVCRIDPAHTGSILHMPEMKMYIAIYKTMQCCLPAATSWQLAFAIARYTFE